MKEINNITLEEFLEAYKKYHYDKYFFTNHEKRKISLGITAGEKKGAKDAFEVLKQLLEVKDESSTGTS